jgi:hypothetical protein
MGVRNPDRAGFPMDKQQTSSMTPRPRFASEHEDAREETRAAAIRLDLTGIGAWPKCREDDGLWYWQSRAAPYRSSAWLATAFSYFTLGARLHALGVRGPVIPARMAEASSLTWLQPVTSSSQSRTSPDAPLVTLRFELRPAMNSSARGRDGDNRDNEWRMTNTQRRNPHHNCFLAVSPGYLSKVATATMVSGVHIQT